ncbi:MAG: (d)CMP kinase, partial [Planctomycetales bacterium]|nr:(d)CMP kinase [Planctomycetales bacterium]
MIVTIDGPAGAGKSTIARQLAARLGFRFLDTGAMYRAATLAALRADLDLHDSAAVAELVATLDIDCVDGRALLNGSDVSAAIRTAEVTASV